MSMDQLRQDIETLKKGRRNFTIMSLFAWVAVAALIGSVSTFTAILLLLAALISCVMPIGSHFALKQRKAELESIQ